MPRPVAFPAPAARADVQSHQQRHWSTVEEHLILDRYRPLADLGSGGFGSVVLAFDTKMARRVAIKRLPLEGGRTLERRAGLAEARTAAMLNHPAIVTVHEWDTDDSAAYIVMEDIDGASLADILDERGVPLDRDECAAVLEAVAGAVAFAHANGVLHLDLKPANILVTRDGRVKVADFGIAALTDATGRAQGASGTLGSMPPEQLRGEPVDERTDVWALGALMYELLTRANPFDAETAEGSLFKIEVAPVPAPSEFEPMLSERVDEVLLDALAPDPDDRFESIEELADALEPMLGDARNGRRSLARYLDDALGDDIEYEGEHGRLGLWDALGPHSAWFRRAAAAGVSGWLAWAGVSALLPNTEAGLAAGALAALAGALAPGLGLALGGVSFSAGLGVVAEWWIGAAAFVLLAIHWVVVGRHGEGDALLPAAGPLLGAARMAPAAPLLAGFAFPPLLAAAAGGVSALLTMLVSAAMGGSAPLLTSGWSWLWRPWSGVTTSDAALNTMSDPGVLVVVATWSLAAAASSALCGRRSRGAAFLGTGVGVAIIAGGYMLWGLLSDSTGLLPAAAIDLGVSVALLTAVIVLGPPPQPRDA